jgi:hypothetical protein
VRIALRRFTAAEIGSAAAPEAAVLAEESLIRVARSPIPASHQLFLPHFEPMPAPSPRSAIQTRWRSSRNSARMSHPWARTSPTWFPVESSPGPTQSACFQATRGRISREPPWRRF